MEKTDRRRGSRDQESGGQESVIGIPRSNGLYTDRSRNEDRKRSRVRDLHDRAKVRQKRDPKERETLNGFYSSRSSTSSSSGDSKNGQTRSAFPRRLVDREPGELSSGSGSDNPEAPASRIGENVVREWKNEAFTQPSRKRKFSPIMWDRDDNKHSRVVASRSKIDPLISVSLPPPPPLPHGVIPSNSIEQKVYEDASHGSRLSKDRKLGQVEEDEEEYAPTRNISASRWADRNNAVQDGEVNGFDEENVPKRGEYTPVIDYVDQRLHKALTPELGEAALGEGLEGVVSKLSDSEGESREEYEKIKLEKNDIMDVDGEETDGDLIDHQSNTDSEAEDDEVKTPEPVRPPQRSINMLQGCRGVDEFERLNKIAEGTYGVVYRAKDKKTGEIVALKKVKMAKEREGFPLTSLREINILLSFHHPSIVDVKGVVVDSSLESVFMVMEYMEHDLKALMENMKHPFSQSEVKCLMLQLLEGVKYLHDNWVLHRDLKTSNLLLNNCGELKICDFGLSRQYGSPLKPYTHLVVTLWYRAPELLLGAKEYSTAIDMWSLGCIMAELLAKESLFSGKTEFDQLDKIFRILGTPNENIWPGFEKLPGVKVNFVKQPYNKLRNKFPAISFSGRPTLSEAGFDLLNKLLSYDPEKRITAEAALNHGWFHEVPLPKSKDFMPTFPAQHAQERRLRRIMKSPDPLEEQRRKELHQEEVGTGSLFG